MEKGFRVWGLGFGVIGFNSGFRAFIFQEQGVWRPTQSAIGLIPIPGGMWCGNQPWLMKGLVVHAVCSKLAKMTWVSGTAKLRGLRVVRGCCFKTSER